MPTFTTVGARMSARRRDSDNEESRMAVVLLLARLTCNWASPSSTQTFADTTIDNISSCTSIAGKGHRNVNYHGLVDSLKGHSTNVYRSCTFYEASLLIHQISNQGSTHKSPSSYVPRSRLVRAALKSQARLPAALTDIMQPKKNDVLGANRIGPDTPLWIHARRRRQLL